MELHIDALEALWLAINLAAAIFTGAALWEAWRVREVISGPARELIARGNVRREILRLAVQLLLLSLVAPGLTTDTATPLSFFVLVFMLIPALLLASTFFDTLDRHKLLSMSIESIETERQRDVSRLEQALAENTDLTRLAAEKADAAYHEANNVNNKIANLQREDIAALTRNEEARPPQ